MNNINQNSSNDQFSGDLAVNIDLNATMRSYLPQTQHETEGNTKHDSTLGQGNLLPTEENNSISLDTTHTNHLITIPGNQDNHGVGYTATDHHEEIRTEFDPQYANNELDNINSSSLVQSVGHILRKARAAKGLSIDDVSRQLRLSVQQVEAIEKEDYEKLPGRTFLRGFIRNYANLLQLNSVPLLQMLPESAPVKSTYERTPLSKKQISFVSNRQNPGSNRLIIIIVLLIFILGIYYFSDRDYWNKNSANSVNNATNVITDKASVEIHLPLSSPVRDGLNTQSNKIPEINTQIIFDKSSIEPHTKTELLTIPIENKSDSKETQQPSAMLSNGMGNLHFRFTADSWVKIIDGNDVTILEQIRKGGSEQTITGKRPFSIVLGNAAGVNLTYNDTEIDLSSYKKQDGTARFTLE